MAQESKRASRSIQDVERNAIDESHLENTTVQSLAWRGINVVKKGWTADAGLAPILSNIDGYTEAGTLTYSMGACERVSALNRIRDTHCPHGTFW